MRRLTTTLTAILMVMLCCSFASAQRFTISGRIVDDQAKQIPYATVVLLEEGDQVSGGVTDSEGKFSLLATAGSYQLHVSYIGYKSISKEISIEGDLAWVTYSLRRIAQTSTRWWLQHSSYVARPTASW